MTQQKRQHFTPEDFKRLARNPFVDKKMLQFVKNKTIAPSSGTASPGSTSVPVRPTGQSAGVSRMSASRRPPVMSEKTALLIAMAIKGMLRD